MRWNLSVAALATSWGLISVLVSAVDLDATVLVFYRLLLAALTVAVVAAAAGRARLLRLPPRPWRLAVVGVVLAVHWSLFFLTIKLASVAVAVLTVYTAPIFIAVLAPLVLPERRSRVSLAALVPAGLGMALIALTSGGDGAHVDGLALATGLGAAATYAALVIATKRLRAGLEPTTIALWAYLVAATSLAPLLPTADRVLPDSAVEAGALALLGIVFTGVSGLIYITLLGHVTAQAVGILAFLEPVAAAVLAWLLLDEPLDAAILFGGGLVLAAGVLVVLREPPDALSVEAPLGAGAVEAGALEPGPEPSRIRA